MYNFFSPPDAFIQERPDGDTVLFNFKWQKSHIQNLRDLAKARGTTSSAIIKTLLLQEFKTARRDNEYEN